MALLDRDRERYQPTQEIPQENGYTGTRKARTSAVSVVAVMVGLTAVLAVLTLVLTPVAIVLGVAGLVLAFAGMRKARQPHITGRGVAVFAAVLSVVALVLSTLVIIGVTTFMNDDAAVNRLENRVQQLRDDLPQRVEIPRP